MEDVRENSSLEALEVSMKTIWKSAESLEIFRDVQTASIFQALEIPSPGTSM